jgi:UDP:flavonoid glycosyltransferase YjiC (YdhE family)
MRLLFTFSGGSGHLDPLLPVARAAHAAGHEVAFTGRPWMTSRVEAHGFRCFPAGDDRGLTPERRPLLALDVAREEDDFRFGFAGRIARERSADVLPIAESWRPDVIVAEETDFGPMVVAERLGIPHATVITMAAGSMVRPSLLAGTLDELRADHGLSPDPDLAMVSGSLVLSPIPPGFRDPAFPLPAASLEYRVPPAHDTAIDAERATWASRLAGRSAIYATLGTVFNNESGDLFERLIEGLGALDALTVLTTGPDFDPAELGALPANVIVERYVPLAAIVPLVDLVVSHGGSGTIVGTMVQGVPMVLIPMGADQPHNAVRAEALGIARVLDPVAATPADIGSAARDLLTEPSFRAAAEALRDAAARLPGPDAAVARLEALAAAGTARA